MCGITGFWNTKADWTREHSQETIALMTEKLWHRGPDASGIWLEENQGVAIGHRRLAIIDISDNGRQPMHSSSGRYTIAFNGEIYNFKEIKQQLEQQDRAPVWRGHSDTEVILAAIDAWGVEDAIKNFVGMFAIALWDKQERQLFLIRDRMGEKPLYYGWIGSHFLFGSELKAMRAHPFWQQEIDPQSVALQLRYNCIPAPYTVYEDIFKLPPGHLLVLNKEQSLSIKPYWSLKQVIEKQTGASAFANDDAAIDQLQAVLSHTISGQMISDVPLGAFLSGGIDSSMVVALMQAQSSKPVKTFTIGFDNAQYNEADYAKKIAKHLGTEHTEHYLSSQETQDVIYNLPDFFDEPFSDSSQIPTYIVSKLTRSKVTVSLSGDGGDELFCGYNRYHWVSSLWQKARFMPKSVRGIFAKGLLSLSPQKWDSLFALANPILPRFAKQRNPGDKLHKLAGIIDADTPMDIYQNLIAHWKTSDHVVPESDPNDLILSREALSERQHPFTEHMMYLDAISYLPDDILVKVDRAAMAVSLETRIPFLDHRVVEFAWSLPMSLKYRNGHGKWILKQLLQRYLPVELIERPKMGFGIPIDSWLRGPLKDWAGHLLSHDSLKKHSLFRNELIDLKWSEHLKGHRNWQYHLWDVLMFQAWYEAYHG